MSNNYNNLRHGTFADYEHNNGRYNQVRSHEHVMGEAMGAYYDVLRSGDAPPRIWQKRRTSDDWQFDPMTLEPANIERICYAHAKGEHEFRTDHACPACRDAVQQLLGA